MAKRPCGKHMSASRRTTDIRRQSYARRDRNCCSRGTNSVLPAFQLRQIPNSVYAADPAAHLQAVGRDAAGRLQYRYPPQWEDVRESRKARRLARLAHALPQVRRSIGQYLAADQQTREFACAAVIELVACSAIRP